MMKLWPALLLITGAFGLLEARAGEPDLGAPAPQQELELAHEYLSARLGPELVESAVIMVGSGSKNSGGEITGYFVCYRFFPPTYRGVYVPLCVEREIENGYRDAVPGRIPDCGARPELCEVRIGLTEALQIALDHGLEGGLGRASISLKIVAGHDSLVWLILERPADATADVVDTYGWRRFLVDARTGDSEIQPGN